MNFPGATNITDTAKVLELPCDILIPAALENQITEKNAGHIQARIVAEGANGPTTFDADKILKQRRILAVPDLFLNAGGVTVSYFEWLKNLSHVRFGRMGKRFDEMTSMKLLGAVEKATGQKLSDEEKRNLTKGAEEEDLVNSGLEETMINAYHQIREIKLTTKRCAGSSDCCFHECH